MKTNEFKILYFNTTNSFMDCLVVCKVKLFQFSKEFVFL